MGDTRKDTAVARRRKWLRGGARNGPALGACASLICFTLAVINKPDKVDEIIIGFSAVLDVDFIWWRYLIWKYPYENSQGSRERNT